jgi:hypothetical protein
MSKIIASKDTFPENRPRPGSVAACLHFSPVPENFSLPPSLFPNVFGYLFRIAVDMVTDEIYCAKCNNYVFDFALASIAAEERHNAQLYRAAVDAQQNVVQKVASWRPTPEEAAIIHHKAKPVRTPTHLLGSEMVSLILIHLEARLTF